MEKLKFEHRYKRKEIEEMLGYKVKIKKEK